MCCCIVRTFVLSIHGHISIIPNQNGSGTNYEKENNIPVITRYFIYTRNKSVYWFDITVLLHFLRTHSSCKLCFMSLNRLRYCSIQSNLQLYSSTLASLWAAIVLRRRSHKVLKVDKAIVSFVMKIDTLDCIPLEQSAALIPTQHRHSEAALTTNLNLLSFLFSVTRGSFITALLVLFMPRKNFKAQIYNIDTDRAQVCLTLAVYM